jgi:uncharacterized membrane protein (DUF4010 family)
VDLPSIVGLLIATLGGAAIGLERQWSGHASGAHARFGGIRTFTLLGALAGLAGWLSTGDFNPLAVVLLAAAAALVVAGYVAASRADIDGTTEVAALVVLAAGTLAGAGYLALASAVIAATALLLLEKTRLHAWVTRIDDASLRASVRFAAMACIILPLLPTGPYGPLDAVRPRELWAFVLFFSGLSFIGWLTRRLVGPHHGVIVAGILGGVISSTSVTFRFARDSRSAHGPGTALAGGVVAACTVMLLRVTVACAVLNPALAMELPRYVGPAFVIGAIAVLLVWRAGSRAEPAVEPVADSPLHLRAALQMTGLFQIVLFVILAVQARWSAEALMATSAVVGLTDLDALTLSLARSTTTPADMAPAAGALVAGILSNTLLKLTTALVIGRGSFRVGTTLGLGAMAVALIVTLVL